MEITNTSGIAGSQISQSLGTHTAPESEAVAKASSQQARNRTDEQPGSTRVTLSANGQAKAALAQAETAARAAATLKSEAAPADIKQAATDLVEAVNKTNESVSAALAEGNDLKKIGITRNKDGSLAIDAHALDKALQTNPDQARAALRSAAGRIESAAAAELTGAGNVTAGGQPAYQRTFNA